ncbi:GRASP55/65 PDZ-like domain-containing protein [Boletus edulis BED1]|uniref:GRASP55/65 PDZ-like domain-containing protein n=1 Tax=Boletus edulis BED1 TaxID=1328754 RepID=A0AAD4BYH5_BOLED|nr:GRASP55/65 PDZ-like domain-containing protein [Boletus edulis BED1]
MGASQSTSSQTQTSHALHVLRVTPSSPASQTSIEPFFDFIVGYNDINSFSARTELDATELERIVEEHEGRVLNLLVWSSKTRETRVVPIVPSRGWALAQQAVLPLEDSGASPQPSLLGLSMRMCEFESTTDNVWHVLEVVEGGPAESAGLVPYGDWIIGWSGGVLSAENDFYELVESHVDKPLRVYVYSYDFDNLREVVLVPNRHWGGEGLLGCVFGFGYLHRIPSQPSDRKPLDALHEQSDLEDQQLFVPADVPINSPPSGPVSGDYGHPPRRAPLVVAHPHPTRAREMTHGSLITQLDVTPNPLPALAHQDVQPRRRLFQAALLALPSTVIRHANHDCVRTLKKVYTRQGTGATPGLYSVASPKQQWLSTHKASRTIEHEEDDEGDISDGNGSVSGTDLGSLTSVE